jgi:hypothetical protein
MLDELEKHSNGNTNPDDKLQLLQGYRIETAVETVSHFEQLLGLVEVSEIIPLTRHAAPDSAALELKDMMLTVLQRNGASCYLAGLPKEESRKATLQLARLLESLVPEEDTRDRLLDGALALRDLPEVETRVFSHISAATASQRALASPRAGDTARK